MLDPRKHPELLTPAEMAEADRFAVAAGTPGIVLMERAGLAVADEAARQARSRGRIAVLCGPGETAATASSPPGCSLDAATSSSSGSSAAAMRLRGDAAIAASRFKGLVRPAADVDLSDADCVIDALFGAGLARDIEGEAKAVVERINAFARAGGKVVAVDVPSGVDGETGGSAGRPSRPRRPSPSSA